MTRKRSNKKSRSRKRPTRKRIVRRTARRAYKKRSRKIKRKSRRLKMNHDEIKYKILQLEDREKKLNNEILFTKTLIIKIPFLTIPAGTIFYRTQPKNCLLKISNCVDTSKKGIYFSSGKYVPLGMILEYNKDMYLCKYKTKRKITMYVGKYSFRYLEPMHFFRTQEDLEKGIFITNKAPSKSYNHIEQDLLPIHKIFREEIWKKLNEDEYFITNLDDVESISEPKYIDIKEATQMLKEKEKELKNKND